MSKATREPPPALQRRPLSPRQTGTAESAQKPKTQAIMAESSRESVCLTRPYKAGAVFSSNSKDSGRDRQPFNFGCIENSAWKVSIYGHKIDCISNLKQSFI